MPEHIADVIGMFTLRTRERECRSCGHSFVQKELSGKFVALLAKMPESTQRAWKAVVTENALPLFCLACERRDIAFDHRAPTAPTGPTYANPQEPRVSPVLAGAIS